MPANFVLTLSCADRPGIVAAVTTELAALDANIAESNQFWDRETGTFFMRLAFAAPDGVSREAIEAQARALGLPIDIVTVPKGCCLHTYNDSLATAAAAKRDLGVSKIAFGDLYLDDLRDFREECLEMIGMEAIFPLWQLDTQELAWAYVHAKYKAVVTCVDEQSLPRSFAGRLYDRAFLSDLPLGVDPCGENGEFHTFVFDGPVFDHPVAIKQGTPYSEASMHYCDVLGQSNPPKQAMRRAR